MRMVAILMMMRQHQRKNEGYAELSKRRFLLSIQLRSNTEITSDRRRDRQYKSYLALCRLIPEFHNKVTELHEDELIDFYSKVGDTNKSLDVALTGLYS
jgi:hypothetical protein